MSLLDQIVAESEAHNREAHNRRDLLAAFFWLTQKANVDASIDSALLEEARAAHKHWSCYMDRFHPEVTPVSPYLLKSLAR